MTCIKFIQDSLSLIIYTQIMLFIIPTSIKSLFKRNRKWFVFFDFASSLFINLKEMQNSLETSNKETIQDTINVLNGDYEVQETSFMPQDLKPIQILLSMNDLGRRKEKVKLYIKNGIKCALLILILILSTLFIIRMIERGQINFLQMQSESDLQSGLQQTYQFPNEQKIQAEKNVKLPLTAQIANITKKHDEFFNLWDINPSQKIEILRKFELYKQNNAQSKDNGMMILSSPDEETEQIFKDFEANSYQIKWQNISIDDYTKRIYQTQFKKSLRQRTGDIGFFLRRFRTYMASNLTIYNYTDIRIRQGQFYSAIQYLRLTDPTKPNNSQQISKRYKTYLENKYEISRYKNQIKACIIVPTFNNTNKARYMWNIQSILQQQYDNYKVIIVDDASKDETSLKIATYLRLINAPNDKFVVIRSNRRNKSLYNFYYAAHKYCNLGEIIYTIDGDDQLIGTQVLKIVNAVYQKEKVYTLYTTYINKSKKLLQLGYNKNYSQLTILKNAFRKDQSHSYSHLRTMLSDTFLLANSSSFKDTNGSFYQFITDNAVYFSALQLSCKRVRFLQEITYLYDYGTDDNIIKHVNKTKYYETRKEIENKSSYKCIEDYLQQAIWWYNSTYQQ